MVHAAYVEYGPYSRRPRLRRRDRVRPPARGLHVYVALVTDQSITDVSQNVFANLGWDEIRLSAPVFEGNTIYFRSEVLETRDSRLRPGVGIVKVKTTGHNQDGKTVITFLRTVMVYRRDHAPRVSRPAPEE